MQNKSKRSIVKELQTPEFKSGAEEARWYEKNQDALLAEFKGAPKSAASNKSETAGRVVPPAASRKNKLIADPITGLPVLSAGKMPWC